MRDQRVMNHKVHIILFFVTLGFWWPFYLGLYLIYKISGSTIEIRRERRRTKKELAKEKMEINEARKVEQRKANYAKEVERLQLNNGLSKPYKGYKQGKKGIFQSGQAYTLACGHQIYAKKRVGILSNGLLNQTVLCDVCNSKRKVTGTLYPWDNK